MLSPNTIVYQRYQIRRAIGQGGMGAVYEALDLRLKSVVALKQTLVSGPALAQAFEREAQILASLRHPALPKVIDYFFEGPGQFLVMEYIPGEDLGAILERQGGPLAVPQVLAWADQILGALEYLHEQAPPIIHRDIKPQNLKLTPRGEVLLLDFGLAKGMGAGGTATIAGQSLFAYTLQYAPPEQIQGTGTGPYSDLYSLAATLFVLLTGQPPADAISRATSMVTGRTDPQRLAHQLAPQVPPEVGLALHRAMALDPAQRHRSAAQLRAALAAAAGASPPQARPAPGPPRGVAPRPPAPPPAAPQPAAPQPKPVPSPAPPPAPPLAAPQGPVAPPQPLRVAPPDPQLTLPPEGAAPPPRSSNTLSIPLILGSATVIALVSAFLIFASLSVAMARREQGGVGLAPAATSAITSSAATTVAAATAVPAAISSSADPLSVAQLEIREVKDASELANSDEVLVYSDCKNYPSPKDTARIILVKNSSERRSFSFNGRFYAIHKGQYNRSFITNTGEKCVYVETTSLINIRVIDSGVSLILAEQFRFEPDKIYRVALIE